MAVTIKDIARMANVSHTTVSRALNDSQLINEETRKRIKELAQKLNYVPNFSAKSLVLEKSYNIGVFASKQIEKLQTSFFYEIMEGASSVIGDTYNVVFKKLSSMEEVDKIINIRKYDGIIFISMDVSDIQMLYRLSQSGIPLVVLNRNVKSDGISCVYTDEYTGTFNAMEYIVNLGHKRIAIIEGAEMFITSSQRYEGYVAALKKNNLPVEDKYIVRGGFSPESGFEAMEKLLETSPRPTAVFASNDLMAVGAIKACNSNNIRVPEDISIIGFDDMDFSRYLIPSLTTVNKSRRALGTEGARMLLEKIEKKSEDSLSKELTTNLIIRESCTARI